ncbi:MAG: RHS repeat protein, partial [Planctomycetes bacterium]|nr:RHS repeat protein [Planctomycetota bacterium]
PDNVIRTLYDERGLIFQVIRGQGDPNQSTTQYDYDGNTNIIRVHEGLEDTPRTTTSQFDGYDRLIQANDPMGNIVEFHYDPAGNLISKRIDGELTDVDGDAGNVRLSELNYEYDSLNRPTRLTVAFFDPNTQMSIGDGNAITEYQYSDNSQVVMVIDDNGNYTHYEYDTVNRKKRITDAKNNKKSYAYDKKSNVISVTEVEESDLSEPNAIFTTTYAYDNLDRLTRVTDNNNNTTEYGYDSRDNRRRVTDALGNETRYEYDGLNRLTRTIRDMDGDGADAGDADDIKTGRTYDDNSRLIGQTDDNGNTAGYEYDALNRWIRTTYADGTVVTSTYDVYDDTVGTVDAAGTVSVRGYDKLHRLTRGRHTPGTGVSNDPNFEDYRYDGLSRMVYAENNNSVVTRAYDSLSNTVEEVQSGRVIRSTYDGLGNKLSCTYPGDRIITNTYDALNRLSTTSAGSYDYIGPRRVRRFSYNNSIQNDYSYDNVKRITGTNHAGPAAVGTVDERSYSYDAMYNKIQRKDKRVGGQRLTHDYTYDDIYRLVNTSVTSTVPRNTAYTLDGVGNRTVAYTMDGTTPIPADFQMNQYTTTPFDSREYDDNSNLKNIDNGLATQKNITYDYRNQMVEVDDINTGQIHTYAYDALGRRIEKVVDSGGTTPQITRYFYDGARVIEEQDNTGTTLATYVYGTYIDEVLHMRRGTADTAIDYYYHTDDMYNVMAVTDSAGAVVERYEYGDYGEPDFILTTAGVDNPYLFNGRRYDDETGLYYYRTRYLDPKAGRFVSRDTIGIWGDASNLGNGSAYVGNNPWTNTDPMGLGGGDPLKGLNVSKARYYSCGCENGSSCGGHCGGIAGPGGGHGGVNSMAKGTMRNSSTSAGGSGRHHGHITVLKVAEHHGHITVLKVAEHHGHITVLKASEHHGHVTVLKASGGGDGGGNAKCHPDGEVGASRGNTFYCVFCTCGCRPTTSGCSSNSIQNMK